MRKLVYYSVAIAALVLTPLVVPHVVHYDAANTATATQLGQPVAANPGFAVDTAVRRASPICKDRGGVMVGGTSMRSSMGVFKGTKYAHCADGSLVTWK